MIIYDLFSGLGGGRRRKQIEGRGHKLVTSDINPSFQCDITKDILEMTAADLAEADFVWLSVPCDCFSVASIGTYWNASDRTPKRPEAVQAQRLVEHSRRIVEAANPRYGWMMENPRGMLRTLPCVAGLPRVTVTYCQYGERNMKPTDLFGYPPKGWKPRPHCKNGDPCHESAPRGARSGTQGIKGAAERAVVPWQLWDDILTALEGGEIKPMGQGFLNI